MAVDLAEKQLRDGTASSQVITHYLKLGSSKERIEKEILEKQKELIEAKTQNLQSAKRVEELYTNALNAMRHYSGAGAMKMSVRTYTELISLPTFEERFRYLKLDGKIGEATFGFQRWLNQEFYHSSEWLSFRETTLSFEIMGAIWELPAMKYLDRY